MKKCDIIVPIYNAFDCLEPCINSIIMNTDMVSNRLILIDDCSSDKNVLPLLNTFSKKHKNIILLKNKDNQGFVKTVNIGMKYSDNDVLLLNSDTEVTKDWLLKIQKCAYSSSSIATVTPLSNNATLASVPKSFMPNNLPDGLSLDEMADIVEKASFNYYPEIPTGHGFCLFIKRDALDKVGYFDEESYGKGYGEENDFCYRCFEYGYRHVLCDNTYILHKESQSFKESKELLIKQGLETLREKYPIYVPKLEKWVFENTISWIGNNISFNIMQKNEKPNILLVIHDWNDISTNIGGTSLHVWDIVRYNRDKYNFHILSFDDNHYKVYSYFNNGEFYVNYHYVDCNMTIVNYYNSDYRRIIEDIIDKYKISFVHIHHIISHYFDIVDVLKENNIKYIISLHDYYFVCPLIVKMKKNGIYCDRPSVKECNECLLESFEQKIDIISWREETIKILKNAEIVITPSMSAKEEILKTIKLDKDICVIEHGIDIKKKISKIKLDDGENDIAFIGGIGISKGSKYLEAFIKKKLIRNGKVHLFGSTSSLVSKSNGHFVNHGKYKRDDLNNLLEKNKIKLICLFSVWPETYSYTLNEAIACGIPVVSFDYGAIAERIKKYNFGCIIDSKLSPREVAQVIDKILVDKEEYNKKVKAINDYKIITTKKMSKKYDDIYSKYAKNLGKLDSDISNIIYNNRKLKIDGENYPNYSWVFGTLKWRIIDKIKIPKTIKKLVNRGDDSNE